MTASPPEILEAVPGIWCVREYAALAYLVKLLPGGVLIDTGPDPSGASVMLALQRARVGLRSLRGVLLTHADYDASAGAARLTERSGAPIHVSAGQAAVLRKTRRAPRPSGLGGLLPSSRRDDAPGVALDSQGEALRDGARIQELFEAVSVGGPDADEGHFVFFFEPLRALFSGDAIEFREGRFWCAPGFDVERLRERVPDVRVLLPNHGAPRADGVGRRWAELQNANGDRARPTPRAR